MTVEKVFMFHHRDRKHPSLLSGNPCQLSANLLTCGGDLVLPTTSQEDIISPPLDSTPPTHKHFPGILPKNLLHTTTFSIPVLIFLPCLHFSSCLFIFAAMREFGQLFSSIFSSFLAKIQHQFIGEKRSQWNISISLWGTESNRVPMPLNPCASLWFNIEPLCELRTNTLPYRTTPCDSLSN